MAYLIYGLTETSNRALYERMNLFPVAFLSDNIFYVNHEGMQPTIRVSSARMLTPFHQTEVNRNKRGQPLSSQISSSLYTNPVASPDQRFRGHC